MVDTRHPSAKDALHAILRRKRYPDGWREKEGRMVVERLHPREKIHIPFSLGEKTADAVASFVGSWKFVGIHICWFTAWIILHIEPFPFGLLTLIVSLEAIFLTTFVMMSQNRQSAKDRVRDDLEAQEVGEIHQGLQLLKEIDEQQLRILTMLKEEKERA